MTRTDEDVEFKLKRAQSARRRSSKDILRNSNLGFIKAGADDALLNNSGNLATNFAATWISSNIFPGPFTQSDAEIGKKIISDFVAGAEREGLTVHDLELALGDLQAFLRRAYAGANTQWRTSLTARSRQL